MYDKTYYIGLTQDDVMFLINNIKSQLFNCPDPKTTAHLFKVLRQLHHATGMEVQNGC